MDNLPIPTDSLHKFKSVLGLAGILASTILTIQWFLNVQDRMFRTQVSAATLQIDIRSMHTESSATPKSLRDARSDYSKQLGLEKRIATLSVQERQVRVLFCELIGGCVAGLALLYPFGSLMVQGFRGWEGAQKRLDDAEMHEARLGGSRAPRS